MKAGCLKYFICADSSDEQTAFVGLYKIIICSLISFFSLQLNEFLQLEIRQKLSSVKKNISITAIADKVMGVFCVSRVLYSPPHSAVQNK